MAEVSILSGELVSGRRLTQVPAVSGPVRAVLGAAGEISCSIPLRDRDVRPRTQELISTLEPWRTFLAFQAGDTIVEAGPISTHPTYDDATGNLTVKAVGLRGIFEDRHVIDATAAQPELVTLTYSGSLATIGKRIVQRTLDNPGGSLPIVLPEDEDGDSEWEFRGAEFHKVGAKLDELSNVAGGPEFAFEPRFTEDGLGVEWVMRAGTTAQPLLSQTGSDWIWDTTTRGAVAGLSVSRDASSRTNSVYVTGQGMDEAIPVARLDNPDEWDRDYPLLESVYAHSTTSRQSTLDRWAASYISQGSRPWTEWKLEVLRDAYPALSQYRPGDWAAVHVADHPYLPDGTYRTRIGSIEASLDSHTVSLGMRPTLDWR